jgi:Glycosyltransferase family 9 (heptosyltransferase)
MEEEVMGIGDDIIATGMARGLSEQGKRAAFGDGRVQRWGPHSEIIFRGNPNIAPRGQERLPGVEWITYYKGNRIYNSPGSNRWVWNYKFKARPGEIYFDAQDEMPDEGSNLVLIEPNVPSGKKCAPNKQWHVDRWHAVASKLEREGFKVRQFEYGGQNQVCEGIKTPTFRQAAKLLTKCRVAILPEGGLHHAAAAVGVPAVVLFGGFVPPAVLGYDGHVNLTGGADACGSFNRCPHCAAAMAAIKVDNVLDAVERFLCR